MMPLRLRQLALLGAAFPVLLLAGCGAPKPKPAGSVAPPPQAQDATRETVGRAIDLLNRGKEDEARRALAALLRRQPSDPIATRLLRQIEDDPQAMLGREGFDYSVKAGDTLSELAGRFLGNPTLFYALGRYNHLTFPATLSAGQTLRIPGQPKMAKPAASVDKPRPVPKAVTAPKPPITKPLAPPVDPNRAIRLRAAALEQLNRGQVDRAVLLLQQAAAAAPGNALIKRDLDRALRIRHTIRP